MVAGDLSNTSLAVLVGESASPLFLALTRCHRDSVITFPAMTASCMCGTDLYLELGQKNSLTTDLRSTGRDR